MKLSVVIPTLNEAANLKPLLEDLLAQQGVELSIVVSDGGSSDNTLLIADEFNVKTIVSEKGRAKQMNTAFTYCPNELILFLHADSRIPSRTLLSLALAAFNERRTQLGHHRLAGHFPLKFLRTQCLNSTSFKYIEEKTHFNRTNTTNGDQGFLLTASYFLELGGFDDSLPFLEDQKLAEAIRKKGEWMTLPGNLCTSARRFEVEGFHRRYILMGIIMGLHSIENTHFFNRAKDVYQEQSASSHLLLSPFFNCIWKMMWFDLSLKENFVTWFGIGRYIRHNSWQMFYFFDILSRRFKPEKNYPCLKFHDKIFWPVTNNFPCDCITSLLSFVWFMLCLGPYFYLTEKIISRLTQSKIINRTGILSK